MKEMINSYLAFTKGEGEEKVTNENVFLFFKNIVNNTNNPKKIKISLKISKNITFFIKNLAIKRAFNNILSNAIYYAKKKIFITVKIVKSKGTLIKFEDDGPGIPKNKRDDVLKAFYRIDESRLSQSGNTGLGLTITKNIISNHGGSLELGDSSIGARSKNILTLNLVNS